MFNRRDLLLPVITAYLREKRFYQRSSPFIVKLRGLLSQKRDRGDLLSLKEAVEIVLGEYSHYQHS